MVDIPNKYEDEDGEGGDENYNPEEEVTGNWAVVNLPEVQVSTGEEEEEVIHKFRAKLYRWVKSEWKERGLGDLKFLQHKTTKKIRIIMRQDKTSKVVANFSVAGKKMCQPVQMKTNDKAWLWICYDCSEEKPQIEKLCAKFPTKEEAEKFKNELTNAYNSNTKILEEAATSKPEESKTEEKVKPDEKEKPEEKTAPVAENK